MSDHYDEFQKPKNGPLLEDPEFRTWCKRLLIGFGFLFALYGLYWFASPYENCYRNNLEVLKEVEVTKFPITASSPPARKTSLASKKVRVIKSCSASTKW